jgi:tetratricopeptide (TPR) repeat protein
LDALSTLSAEAAALCRATAHFGAASAGADAQALETTASAWADADPSAEAAVEWLSRAIITRDLHREVDARERLAARLDGTLSTAVAASARIVARIAHDDLSSPLLPGKDPETILANLELAPPSCDPKRRAAALSDVATALDSASAAPALALAGWNLLAAGDGAGAVRVFRQYVESHAEDVIGWEGLRAAAERNSDKTLLVEATAALGDLVSDPAQGAELWERAATLLIDELGDPVRGEAALGRAVERDIGRHGAFDRLFRIVRARRDGPRLLELVSARLAVAEDPAEIAKLYWERARALREAGDTEGALEALDNVTMLEPDHVGALALTGEICIMNKRFAEAAESLARLATLAEAPAPQRLMSGIAAVDLYENRLGQADQALSVLVKLHQAGLATLPVRERLARAAAKTESWETATRVLEELMAQRETPEGRIEAARLAMAIYRDRLAAPARAEGAVTRLLQEAPADGEALDLVLGNVFSKPVTRKLLAGGRSATIAALLASPLDLENVTRLAEMARQLDDVQLRQATLGAVVALGGQTPATLAELSALDGRIARVPQIAIDDRVIEGLRDPEDRGALPELFRALSTTLAEALGPGLTALGVTKKERVRPQDGLPLRNELAAWAGALGVGEFELYVGGRVADGICAVPTELPAIVVGAAVPYPLSAAHRAALARELLGLRLGTTILRHRDPADIAALVVAACNVAGVRIESPPYAMLAEFERLLSKELPRRVRKVLPDLARAVAESGGDPIAWVRAAKGSLDRMAAISIGDVSWILSGDGGRERGEPPNTTEGRLRAARLLSFVLSPAFPSVRDKLGMGVK